MKNSIKTTVVLLVLFLTACSMIFAQDPVTISSRRNLVFSKESKKAEVKFDFTKEYNFMHIDILSKFVSGTVSVEVIDPNGKKQGTYTVKKEDRVDMGKNTQTSEQVTGQLRKSFRHPIEGEWIIRALPTSASGEIIINITKKFEPQVDVLEIEEISDVQEIKKIKNQAQQE